MRRSEKLFFVFVAIILIPSMIFAYNAYSSLEEKRETLLIKERLQIENILNQISEKTEKELLAREKVETRRPYYEYSYYFTPESVVSNDLVLQQSPLSKFPEDKLIVGYFQIDNKKKLTSPFFFGDELENEMVESLDKKQQFLKLIEAKAYPTLLKEMEITRTNPFKVVNQSAGVQMNYEKIIDIYRIVRSGAPYINIVGPKKFSFPKKDVLKRSLKKLTRHNKKRLFDIIHYHPIQYLYKDGGLFAFRKVVIKQKVYIQGYMLNISYLINEILSKFISENTPKNFSIYTQKLKNIEPFASASISDNLNFIKLFVYKNDNSLIDSIIEKETIKYYSSTFALFSIIFVGFAFIFQTIRSESEINRKKSDFISAVTHELKTPLTSIRMYSEMLLDNMVTDEAKKARYYKFMVKESERLTRLIDNVLDFSKIENNNKVFNMEDGNLSELMLDLCEKYKNNLQLSGFEFIVDINDVSNATFDRDAITQVFINLLDNAVKYSSASALKSIRVSLNESHNRIILEIADKGIGIPKNAQKTIFDKFFRVENEMTRTSKGAGIGLSIVKEYVKAHGGTIDISSKEKRGTRFIISLPKSFNPAS